MSLTQHLRTRGPIRTWWEQHSAGLDPYVAELQRLADRPTAPLSVRGIEHAAAVGGIVGRLIETTVEPAPPYAAILGSGRRQDATLWPTHAPLAESDYSTTAVEWRPTPAGWRHLVPGRDHGAHSVDLQRVAAIETSTAPSLADRARAAAVVASLEAAYRSGQRPAPISAEATSDAVSIIRDQHASLDRAAYLCGGTVRGHVAPVFAAHWADGDLLLGPGRGGGYGLVDIKTASRTTLSHPQWTQQWLWQLLSYAAADAAEDLWRIRAVGLWLPRQDALVMWSVARMWDDLQADPASLARLLQAAYEADYRAARRARR